jgi:peptidoglycan/LPS O-acetylase OafA/YrhL
MQGSSQSEFRRDINGLRAWAVAAVILYHFGVPGFSGGFVGVDIFFVVSGFLMTGIVVGKLERGTFSILDFYLARARRILPALAVLCATLVTVGWFMLMSPDYKKLASHSVYSLAFLSNVEYWQEAGYFDVASHEKWLLHTWSLSVEWQFYLLLPVVLALVWRFRPGRNAQVWTIAGSALLSLALCIWSTESNPSAAFFLLHTRAWEMLCGGLVWMLGARVSLSCGKERLLESTGLLLILAANLLFDKTSAWPGMNAVLPVAGTMMVLWANRISPFTSTRVAQWLGDRSYSLYLWHWPVYVTLVYVELRFEPWAIVGGLVATVVLAHLSYVVVERHMRELLTVGSSRKAVAGLGLVVAAVALPAVLVWKHQGVPGRFPAEIDLVAAESENYNVRRTECHMVRGTTSPSCTYGKGAQRVIVLGDSHAGALVTGIANAMASGEVEVTQWSYSGCLFVNGVRKTPAALALQPKGYQCDGFISWVNAQLSGIPASVPVILVNRYASEAYGNNDEKGEGAPPGIYFTRMYAQPTPEFIGEYAKAITRTTCELAKARPVYLVRPIPEMGTDVPRTLARRMSFGSRGDISISRAAYRARNDWVWKAQDAARAQCGVRILDATAYLCQGDRCFGSRERVPFYHDDDHLSERGSLLLAPMYRQVFQSLPGEKIALRR